jgi:NADPH-dependent glutamate synthase beta subunit-like oxidoreductase
MEASAYDLEMDIVIEAVGQKADDNLAVILPGVEIENGLVKTHPGSCATSRPNVFAGGDIVHGAATVVSAVAEGMKAAREIDAFLKK